MRQLTILIILTNLTLSVTSAEANNYSSQSRYVTSSSSYYRRGNFQGYVSPYHVVRGSLYYTRGNFQGYVYRRR